MSKPDIITIDDVQYVRTDANCPANKLDGLELCIVRSYGAGVFYGYVKEKTPELNGVNIVLLHARRIFCWSGACSLTQLAIDGTANPDGCKITDPIDEQYIANVIELLPMTAKSENSLNRIKPWKK